MGRHGARARRRGRRRGRGAARHPAHGADTGIDDPPRGPIEELDAWARLLARCDEDVAGPGALLRERLAATAPAPDQPVLVHGDFHYGNLLFAGGRVVAVVDWEIASRGSPLLDLGCLAVAGLRRRYAPEPNPTGSIDVPLPRLVAMYGAEPERAGWYIALTCLKYGAILGYNAALHRSGRRPDPIYEHFRATTSGLMRDGLAYFSGGLSRLEARRLDPEED
jgi:aminoglycoside phosphotransferase (APT) family kinase protein